MRTGKASGSGLLVQAADGEKAVGDLPGLVQAQDLFRQLLQHVVGIVPGGEAAGHVRRPETILVKLPVGNVGDPVAENLRQRDLRAFPGKAQQGQGGQKPAVPHAADGKPGGREAAVKIIFRKRPGEKDPVDLLFIFPVKGRDLIEIGIFQTEKTVPAVQPPDGLLKGRPIGFRRKYGNLHHKPHSGAGDTAEGCGMRPPSVSLLLWQKYFQMMTE